MMNNELKEAYQKLIDENIESKSIEEVLEILTNTFPNEVCFSTSFSFEDQVITDYVKIQESKFSRWTPVVCSKILTTLGI